MESSRLRLPTFRPGVPMNTVYGRLRRIREKTGSRGVADLVERLETLRPPLRGGRVAA